MKKYQMAAIFVSTLCLLTGFAWSRPVNLSAPSGQLGAADPKGYLEIWREIDGVGLQLGEGSYLPLRYKFSTDPNAGGILGTGFYVPMFEAKSALIREDTMRIYLPCGKALYLWRSSVDTAKFFTPDKEWAGILNGDDFTLSRDDGWSLLYRQNRLTSIITDNKHSFTWSYQPGNGANISEDGNTLITVEPNAGGLVKAFVVGAKRYEVDYMQRPITQVLTGQTVIKELDQALSSFKYPDGKIDAFQFVLTPELVPTLTFTDRNNEQSFFTWNAKNNYLTTEKGPRGDWTYKVGDAKEDFGVPSLSRISNDGKIESVALDTKLGIYTKTGADGAKTVTQIFETPGSLYHKVKNITQTVQGKTTILAKYSYDEEGRLIRKIDAKDFTSIYTYGEDGKLLKAIMSRPSDLEILNALTKEETTLLKLIAGVTDINKKDSLLEKLAFFYIHDVGSPEKALALLPQITNRQHAFNIQLHAIDGNVTISDQEKGDKLKILEQQYPEEKHLLDILIAARLKAKPMAVTAQ